jgi:hypothetical protein
MVMTDIFEVPDGLAELERELPSIIALIARTARWVHPDTFRALPVWYPEVARGAPSYDANWGSVYTNTNRSTKTTTDKSEANIYASKALVAALGTKKKDNWTVCHIWSVDDSKFQKTNSIVRDRRFYSCVGNMVWLPTPLKGFTDSVPQIKSMLRICAYHLYDWICEHSDVVEVAAEVRSGKLPDGYPVLWPSKERPILPPGIDDVSLTHFPREDVRKALEFWKVEL